MAQSTPNYGDTILESRGWAVSCGGGASMSFPSSSTFFEAK